MRRLRFLGVELLDHISTVFPAVRGLYVDPAKENPGMPWSFTIAPIVEYGAQLQHLEVRATEQAGGES